MRMYTIYFSPLDYPGMYVVRGFTAGSGLPEPKPDPKPLAVVATLAAARSSLPEGLVCFPREARDELQIVETWF